MRPSAALHVAAHTYMGAVTRRSKLGLSLVAGASEGDPPTGIPVVRVSPFLSKNHASQQGTIRPHGDGASAQPDRLWDGVYPSRSSLAQPNQIPPIWLII
jgi:hypothetical protein